jgi:hypothetical protein
MACVLLTLTLSSQSNESNIINSQSKVFTFTYTIRLSVEPQTSPSSRSGIQRILEGKVLCEKIYKR